MSQTHPFLAQDFLIPWSRLAPGIMEADITFALQGAAAAIDALGALPHDQLTFGNTVLGLENATRTLNEAWGRVEHLNSVNNTPVFREIYNRLLPQVSAFSTSITLNPALWAVLKAYAATPEAAALTGPAQRLLTETLADFTENGADLSADDKKRLETLNADLARLTQKYAENVLDATNAWEKTVTDPALLDGLPESALAAAAESARAKGQPGAEHPAWRFTLHAPSISPVLQYAKNETFRRECWEALASIGSQGAWDNTALVWQILELRDSKARLLGKKNFADLTTARRMAGSGDSALRFIEDLHRRVKPHFERETAELERFKADAQQSAPARLAPWELGYWAELQRREKYAFDPEALRAYLPVGGVIEGAFTIFGKLFGIRVLQRDTTFTDPDTGAAKVFPATAKDRSPGTPVDVWHPEVKFYEVFNGDRHLGSFYTDWHPRETKRGGAWMNHLRTGGPRPDGGFAPHLGLMCGNFTPGVNGAEPLLTHDEALTIFHEFGHLLHHILSAVPYETLSGTRVAWDFVELPSQLLENWCWHKESLDIFARHHETHAPLPDELLGKLVRAANYRAATATIRQLSFGKLDLELHIHLAELKGRDLDDIWNNFLADYHVPASAPTPSMARRFSHIFSDPTGYAAGYYSYKWAEVLEADVFTRFLKDGILNEKTGYELREKIFSKGNSEPPEKLFRDFMGRDPDLNALLTREGLV
ncbi:MAG: M3 family metallopeptidase [Puniceicoccales bacterium]|nr:M3 family metallopeptidase [Puniceicoccales bacterium]